MGGVYLSAIKPLSSGARRAELLGASFDLLTAAETLERISESIERRARCQHTVVNVAKLIAMRANPVLRKDVEQSDIINVDGMGIVWGARLIGIQVPERVTGIDLMDQLIEVCARRGYRPYLLGATRPVLYRLVAVLRTRHPRLSLAGSHHGYFAEADEERIVAEIAASHADCLFVALPTPRKEHFIAKHRDALAVPFIMGVGGSFDVLSGAVPRGPRWMQKAGLEWLFRVGQEPRRMWKRYLVTNSKFATLLAAEMMKRCWRRRGRRY